MKKITKYLHTAKSAEEKLEVFTVHVFLIGSGFFSRDKKKSYYCIFLLQNIDVICLYLCNASNLAAKVKQVSEEHSCV